MSCNVMTLNGDVILTEKLTGGLKNDVRNMVNLHASSRKSKKSFLPKVSQILVIMSYS